MIEEEVFSEDKEYSADLKRVESTADLKPGWVIREQGKYGKYLVYTGGGHYDFIDNANNGWSMELEKGPFYLVESDSSLNQTVLGYDKTEYNYMMTDSYHLITHGAGSKNPKPWWERWGK